MAVSENDLIVGPLVPSSGVDTISVDFFVEDDAWLEVYKSGSETPLVLDTDFTFSGEGTSSGTITLTTPANGTDAYSVYLTVPLQRASDLQFRGDFRSGPINIELDRLWQALQGVKTLAQRTINLARTSPALPPLTFSASDTTDGKAVVFNSDSTELVPGPTVDEIEGAQASATAAASSASAAATSASEASTSETNAAASAAEAEAVADGFGTAATKDTGTASGEVPILDGDGLLDLDVMPGSGVFEAAKSTAVTDMDLLTDVGTWTVSGTVTNAPPGLGSGAAVYRVSKRAFTSGPLYTQEAFYATGGKASVPYTRGGTGDPVVWDDWEKVIRSGDILDEDDFASDDPDRPPSQQSTKAYIDANAGVFGDGLEWTDVTSSRSINTTYQNTTGQMLLVAIQINGGEIQVSPDSVTFTTVIPRPGNFNSFFAVPNGSYYRWDGSSLSKTYWAELR